MNRGAWQVTVHGVAKSWTWLSTQIALIYLETTQPSKMSSLQTKKQVQGL